MPSETLLDRCREAVEIAQRHEADDVEVYGQTVESVNSVVEKHDLQIAKSQFETSFGVRAFVDGRLGFASTNDAARLGETCRDAVALARISPQDPHNVLPETQEIVPVEDLFDPKAAEFAASDAVRRAAEMLSLAESIDRRVILNDAWFESSVGETALANSAGLAIAEKGSLFTYGAVATAREGETVSSFDFQFGGARTVDAIDAEAPIRRVCESALASLGAKPGESFKGTVLLSPQAVADLVVGLLLFQLSARNALRGRSRWKSALGESVADSRLTLVDDGRRPGGLATSAFDREGTPRRRQRLIAGGRLDALMHNAYTARAMGETSTASASGSARSIPGIGPSNLEILPGEGSLDELVADVPKGLLIRRFSGNANPISGDFSGATKSAQLIREGRLDRAVSGTMIAGNVFEALRQISGVSANREQVYNYTLPYLRLEGVSVTSE